MKLMPSTLKGKIIGAFAVMIVINFFASTIINAKNSTNQKTQTSVVVQPVDPVVLEANKKQLAELKTKFDYKYDEFNKYGWYTAKTQSTQNSYDRSLLKTYVKDSGYIYLEDQYYGNDWIFHTKVTVKIGDQIYETADIPTYDPDNSETNGSGSVWETISYTKYRDNGIIKAIAESGDNPVKVRFSGKQSVFDMTLLKSDKQAIKDAYEFSELIKKVNGN